MITAISEQYPDREIVLLGDGAYFGETSAWCAP